MTDQVLPPSFIDYKAYSIYPSTPNLAEARKLMKESGVKTPVKLVIRAQNDAPGFMNMADVIQGDLAAIGIDLTVVGSPEQHQQLVHHQLQDEDADGGRAVVVRLPRRGGDPQYPAGPEHPGRALQRCPGSATPPSSRFSTTRPSSVELPVSRPTSSSTTKVMAQQAPIAPLFNPRWYDFVSSRLGGYVYSEAMDAINYNTLSIKG